MAQASRLIRGLTAKGYLRVLAADTTQLVQTAKTRHGLSEVATAALGRTLTGASLLAFLLSKNPTDRFLVQVLGNGPLGGITAEAAIDGRVRGYVRHPQANAPLRPDGKLNVGAVVGKGELKVSRPLRNSELYEATTPLVSGEIAEDLTSYLWSSEQIPSAVLLGVRVQPEGDVVVAGGLVVQVLPDCPDAIISRLEANLKGVSMSNLLLEYSLEDALEVALLGLEYEPFDLRAIGYTQGYVPLHWACRCSRGAVVKSLANFTTKERQDMIEQDGGAEAICHWCNETYTISPQELLDLDTPNQLLN